MAQRLKEELADLPVKFIFKASFDKANRTSINSFRGLGLKKGLQILSEVKKKAQVPILTDIHCARQIPEVAPIVDILQIPAFLCRQTDLITEAAKTKKIINIKKGQFIGPEDIKHIIRKIESTKNKKILITERGFCFGYNDLIVDFRSFPIMKKFGYPVIFDATHSLQKPSAQSGISGGDSQFTETLSLAAAAAGVNGFFFEVHPSPRNALSDPFTTYKLNKLQKLIIKILKVKNALQK